LKFFQKKKVALIIGNGNYQHTTKLKNPTNDSQDIRDSLAQIGFQIFYGENLKQTEFKRLVRDFANSINGAEISLFYYAGHGLQYNGQNFLVPTNAEILSEDEIPDTTVSLDFVQNRMEDSKAKLNLFFLDSCRDNPFEKRIAEANGRSGNIFRGLVNPDMTFTNQSIISFATAPNQVAFDNPRGRNGIYTKNLLKHLTKAGMKIDDILKATIRDVIEETQNFQVPWVHQKLYDDFYLNGKGVRVEIPPKVVEKPKVVEEVSEKTVKVGNLRFQDFDLPEPMNWNSACEYCEKLKLLGFSNWRLPTKEELKIAYKNKDKFRNFKSKISWYWTIKEYNENSSSSWIIGFSYGDDDWGYKTVSYYAVCVEDL